MFNLFKRKTSIVKFMPCIGAEEISDFVVRDLLLDINENNNISIGFCGDICLGAILNKFAYNLIKQKINYQSIKFFNLIEFVAPKIENKYLPFSFFMHNEFYSKLKIHDGQIYKISNKNNLELEEWLDKNVFDILVIEVGCVNDICFHEGRTLKINQSINTIKLSDSVRDEYALFFNDNKAEVPVKGMAINMKKIVKAKKIILLASGETKASSIAEILKHKFHHSFTVTHLLKNKNVILYADLDACQFAKE